MRLLPLPPLQSVAHATLTLCALAVLIPVVLVVVLVVLVELDVERLALTHVVEETLFSLSEAWRE